MEEWTRTFDFQEALRGAPAFSAAAAQDLLKKRNQVVLYVHIPFCNNVCACCIYNKYPTKGALVQDYLDALQKEMEIYRAKPRLQDSEVISGYIGGGTPAVLTTPQLDGLLTSIFSNFKTLLGEPFFTLTVETTPNEMDAEKARMLRSRGIDRISMGAQSFNDVLLRRIGRTHTADKIKQVYALLRETGFPYVCLDLMYGLPGQTLEEWEQTVDEFLALGADSTGIYPYLVIPESKLYADIQNGLVPATPGQEVLDEMFAVGVHKLLSRGYVAVTPNELGKTTLEDADQRWDGTGVQTYPIGPEGYRGVIVSTFPLTTHLAHSWYEGGDLLGVGAGAYGYIRDYWYFNEPDVSKYIAMLRQGRLPIVAGSRITPEEKVARFMVMGTKFLKLLRRDFAARFGVDMQQVFGQELRKLEDWGLITMEEDGLQVTYPKGWYYIDNISKTFYTAANYLMPQTTLSNTNILKFLRKEKRMGKADALFA